MKEARRLTDGKPELDENQLTELDQMLTELTKRISEHPEIIITYFEPDNKKDGGAYITFIGRLKKIDNYKRIFVFEDGREIQICNIINMDVLD